MHLLHPSGFGLYALEKIQTYFDHVAHNVDHAATAMADDCLPLGVGGLVHTRVTRLELPPPQLSRPEEAYARAAASRAAAIARMCSGVEPQHPPINFAPAWSNGPAISA